MKVTADLPKYCCAILEAPDGTLLLERRPPDARRAAGNITCFGGAREEEEAPEACIRRELLEELGWRVGDVERVLILHRAGGVLAWFYRAAAPDRAVPLVTEEGYEALWVRRDELHATPLSPWHRAALNAYFAGHPTATCDP